MARKGWDSLSSGYRKRLEKGGISESAYTRGESLAKARGHEKTPERPRQYNPQQYPTYHTERQRLVQEVNQKRQDFFAASPKWNPAKAKANMAKYAPPISLLRWALNAEYEEWVDALRETPETYAFLGYH